MYLWLIKVNICLLLLPPASCYKYKVYWISVTLYWVRVKSFQCNKNNHISQKGEVTHLSFLLAFHSIKMNLQTRRNDIWFYKHYEKWINGNEAILHYFCVCRLHFYLLTFSLTCLPFLSFILFSMLFSLYDTNNLNSMNTWS